MASGTPGDKARATPVIAGNKLIVGLASLEEALAGSVGFCCSFRGSMLALDVNTGAIIWKTYMVPPGYSGGAIWGSAPAVDLKRGKVYVATGNTYSVPEPVTAGTDTEAVKACLAVDNYFDAVVALDMKTGGVRWATKALPADIWTAAGIGFGDPAFCTNPTGPGGTGGGLQWGSAVDGKCVYTANANSDAVPWPAAFGRRQHLGPGDDDQRRRLRLLARPQQRLYVRAGCRHQRGAVEVLQRWLLPVGRGHLQGPGVLGLGLQQSVWRLRRAEQQVVRVRDPLAVQRCPGRAARWGTAVAPKRDLTTPQTDLHAPARQGFWGARATFGA